MRIAYLDCFSGLSGDMFLGAAVGAGVPLEKLQQAARSLNLGADLSGHTVQRAGLSAFKVDVLIHGRPDQPADDPASSTDAHQRHSHDEDSAHAHTHAHDVSHAHVHSHRGLPEIRQLLSTAPLSTFVRDFAVKAFTLLAEAEGKIHGQPPESIHFHEVGSEDAIVDIVCAGVAAEHLAASRWYVSSLNVGSGTVQCAHGVLPVPAPATAELLRGLPIYSAGPPKELLTPTGAAILRALDVQFAPLPPITLTATGYGAGAREFTSQANAVRLLLGELTMSRASVMPSFGADAGVNESVLVLEANLDDMNPQIVPHVMERLLAAGALDTSVTPIQMKKGRPGLLLTVLASPELAEVLSRILLAETTTLGVRMRTEQRRTLERRHETVESPWGPIRVKLGFLEGTLVNCAPEFEDCRSIAERTGEPLKSVLQQALVLFWAGRERRGPDRLRNHP
jgi:hypothetical protein